MKLKFYLPAFFLFLLPAFYNPSYSQCASSAYISSGKICISLVFDDNNFPSQLPTNIEFEGTVYTYRNGLGVAAFPAIYVKSDDNCTLPINEVNGQVTLNYPSGSIICDNGVILALRDISFTATATMSSNTLNWSINDDNTTNSYEVQRSADGFNFSTIKSIKAKGIAGQEISYVYYDEKPINTAYYRLKMEEKDGSNWFSKVVKVQNESIKNELSIYPNPNKGNFIVRGISSKEIPSLSIFDAQGRKIAFRVSNINDGNQTAAIAVKGMGRGVFFIQFRSGETKVHSRFLLQ